MKRLIVSALAFSPMLALAQNQPNLTYLENTLGTVKRLIGTALPIVVGLALLAFFWGVFQFIWGSSDDSRTEGKQHMIWGIVGLFVMVSIWGLVGFLGNLTGVTTQGGTVTVPSVSGF